MPYQEDILEARLRKVMRMMHKGVTSGANHYCGIRTMRSPMDSWVYQQIIWETRPDVLIEIGNKWGGSALMFSHIIKNAGLNTRIIGVDIKQSILDQRARDIPNSVFIEGDAVEMFGEVCKHLKIGEKVMIMEDSAHTYDVTLAILNKYHEVVTPGQYFIIEDTIMNYGLPRAPEFDAYKACSDFVAKHDNFVIDRARELFVLTYNPNGFLRKL